MLINEKDEKFKLIKELFTFYLTENPNRPEDWYGEKFNKLYDMTNSGLKSLLKIQGWSINKKDENVKV